MRPLPRRSPHKDPGGRAARVRLREQPRGAGVKISSDEAPRGRGGPGRPCPRPLGARELEDECAGTWLRAAGPVPKAARAGPLRGLPGRGPRAATPPPPRPEPGAGRPPRLPAPPSPGPAPRASQPASRRRPRETSPRESAREAAVSQGLRRPPRPRRTWLQVMNSLVWASSTSVHSLLRKAGTFELCFIVSAARRVQILHPNAAAVAAAAAAAPRERPPRRRSSCRAPPPSPARRAARRGGRAAAHDGQVAALGPCALVPRRSRSRPIPDAYRETEKSDWMLPTWRGWEQKGALPSHSPLI